MSRRRRWPQGPRYIVTGHHAQGAKYFVLDRAYCHQEVWHVGSHGKQCRGFDTEHDARRFSRQLNEAA